MPFPVDMHYIIETEQQLGVAFSTGYKTRMQKENGGEFSTLGDEWQLFPFFDPSDRKRMSRTCHHIALETKQAREWDSFPTLGIAIATNGCGDFLVLLPTQENDLLLREEIFKWCHETGEIEKVADSIEKLNDN